MRIIICAILQNIRESVLWSYSGISLLKLSKMSESLQMSPTLNSSKTWLIWKQQPKRYSVWTEVWQEQFMLYVHWRNAMLGLQQSRQRRGWHEVRRDEELRAPPLKLSSAAIQPSSRRLVPSTSPAARPRAGGGPGAGGGWSRGGKETSRPCESRPSPRLSLSGCPGSAGWHVPDPWGASGTTLRVGELGWVKEMHLVLHELLVSWGGREERGDANCFSSKPHPCT